MHQIMSIEEAKQRGLYKVPAIAPRPAPVNVKSVRIEHSSEELRRIKDDVAKGVIPF